MLRLYDTLMGRKRKFVPIRRGRVSMYTCGPTVYDFAHIGNFRTYVFQDALRRWLEYRGYKIRQVMNITDVDDKIIERARKKRVSASKLTGYYTKAFFRDARSLNIERAELYPRASRCVPEMVNLTKTLMRKGCAYRHGDSVFFDTKKAADYGALPRLKGPTVGRTKNEDYATKKDFALWLGEKRSGQTTKLGRGRPGWHVECPAIALRHLGPRMDIQSGGTDLTFPHHENGRTLAEAATGKKFVNYWFHVKHLYINGKKMSKSLGNFYTLRDLLSAGQEPTAIRLLLIGTHYRKRLNFTFGSLERASKGLRRLKCVFDGFKRICDVGDCRAGRPVRLGRLLGTAKSEFARAMDDDIDTARALRAFFRTVSRLGRTPLVGTRPVSRKDAGKVCVFILDADRVLGLLTSSS